jgi:uncharacterized protein (UPF0335 family)
MAVEDSVAQDQLRAFVERIERMEEEKASIAADIKEIYAEAKGNGFDTKVLRKLVAIRKQDANERAEQEAILELYMAALGMVAAPVEEEEEDDRPKVSPSLRRAARDFVKTAEKLGGVTITSGGETIEVGKRKPLPSNPVGFDVGQGV